ncbi:uncharacterized protein LOC135492596 [Lineus longissimus]|uniref:uncharacterized protein LOC135492596 n=1 Tax=Lineus longissimus TaxID=88925 RepID=UPI00315D0923
MGAVLGYRLTLKITTLLKCPIEKATFWTDSLDVVHWVRNQSRRFKPFVANRIAELQTESNPHQWRFVPGKENPADVATRGMSVEDLTSPNVWFQGPEFLHKEESQWPTCKTLINPTDQAVIESSKSCVQTNAMVAVSTPELLERMNYTKYSTWNRLVRVMAWMIRFVHIVRGGPQQRVNRQEPDKNGCNSSELDGSDRQYDGHTSKCKNSGDRQADTDEIPNDALSRDEYQESELAIVRMVQRACLFEDYNALLVGNSARVMKKSVLRSLNPFLDADGVMRVGGRLQHADLPYDVRHPIILPSSHHISVLIVRRAHLYAGHSRGVNATLADIRLRFWILIGREAVKKVAYCCYQCRKMKEQPATQMMAPLPASRVMMSLRAFSYCGVDFAGPFVTKITRFKSAKRYMCLFTCLQTRGVHLEMAYSLETDGFLMAFSRMVARRGKPIEVVSDNGGCLVKGESTLREFVEGMDRTKIVDSVSNQGIRWKFNPPYGSHHGGVFESLIKSAKKALYSIFGEARLTDEELLTGIVEVEGMLNSRPLTYVSSDPKDLEVLTPNHFLVGQCGGQLAPQIVDETDYNPRHRWRLVQDMLYRFWVRWQKEYLTLQQQRGKWREVHSDLAVDDVVVLQEQGCPRWSWPIGKVTEVERGSDGHIRTATVLSRGKTYRRPITRLVPLIAADGETTTEKADDKK